VLFWALDRFSREGTLPTLLHLQRLDSYGVAWKSYTEQYLDSTGIFKDACHLDHGDDSRSRRTSAGRSASSRDYRVRGATVHGWGDRTSAMRRLHAQPSGGAASERIELLEAKAYDRALEPLPRRKRLTTD